MAHEADPTSTGTDRTLVSMLHRGLDPHFDKARSKALETLDSEDILAFWVQATGDGTTLDSAPESVPSPNTTPQIAHLAGFDDGLEFAQVSQLARQLFGHHLGVLIDDTVPNLSPQEALQYLSRDVTRLAHELSSSPAESPVDYPVQASLSTRLGEATALLSDDDLTLFWMQVLTSDGTVRTTVSNNGGDQPFPQEDIDVMIETPVEYAMGVPTRMPPMYQTVILSNLFAQHALVGANTADVDVETFCDESLSMALEAGYHRDVMSDI